MGWYGDGKSGVSRRHNGKAWRRVRDYSSLTALHKVPSVGGVSDADSAQLPTLVSVATQYRGQRPLPQTSCAKPLTDRVRRSEASYSRIVGYVLSRAAEEASYTVRRRRLIPPSGLCASS